VNRTTIDHVIAAIGVDLSQFPDEHHHSLWAGIGPGSEELAGRRLWSHAMRKDRWPRRALVEAAWAAGCTKQSYLGARYRRLAARRGKKRALLAVGHCLLVIFSYMLKSEVEYQDLGVEYFDRWDPERLRR
jgi:transposase